MMMIGRWGIVAVVATMAAGAASPLDAETVARPGLVVTDPDRGCPGITGAFVALLDRERGVLLLSGAPFPGGRQLGEPAGGLLASPWSVAAVGTAGQSQPVWGAAYRRIGSGAIGCVAFDRDRFTSEGDLVTYLQWLIGDVYRQLPADERQAFPAFRLSDRRVRLAILQGDKPAIELSGREGSTLAFRVTGETRTYLVSPYVLEPSLPRVALRIAVTDQPYWQAAPKQPLGWQVAAGDQPCVLEVPRITIAVLGVDPAAATATP
jgi:hypothetical protein